MPYQKSTQASGFRSRVGPDKSKQLRQYADALDKQRKTVVTGMERQGVQMQNEMTRIDALASKKDAYELQNLKQFSSTLNNFLTTVASDVIKPVFDQQIEDGITKGIKYQQGDAEVIAEIEASDAQLKEIEERIAKQAAKVNATEQAIRDQWEKEGKIASLEEEYRLLNIKKLGSNRAFGFRKGMLMEAATGFEAYRDSSLLYNEENERSTLNIGTEEDPIIIGHYHKYTGEDGFEKKKAILSYLTNQYVLEKGKEASLSERFINKHLTRPILASNAEFQQNEAKQALLEEAAASSEFNKYSISQGIIGIDNDHTTLESAIQQWILTEGGNLKALNTAGSKNEISIDNLKEHLIGELSEIRSDSMKNEDDQLDFIEALEGKIKVYVPGVSKRYKNDQGEWVYEKKYLWELWPNKFNIDTIEASLAEETGAYLSKKRSTISARILGDKNRILNDYALDRDKNKFELAVKVLMNNPEYRGYLPEGLEEDMKTRIKVINYEYSVSNKKLDDLYKENNNKPIRFDHPLIAKLNDATVREGLASGKIEEDLFHQNDEARSSHLSNVSILTDFAIQGLSDHAKDGVEWSTDNDQVTKAAALIESSLYNYTKEHYAKKKSDSYTLDDAVEDAMNQLIEEMRTGMDPNVEPVDGKKTWEIDENGFTHQSLNRIAAAQLSTYENVKRDVIKDDATIKALRQRILTSSHVDVFSDKAQSPVVKIEDFKLTRKGEVSQLWEEMARLDPLKRTAEMLYDLQADKFPEIPRGEWSQEIKDEIAEWNALYPHVRNQLVNGNFSAAKRAMQEIGKLDIDSTIGALLDPNGQFSLKESELPLLLSSLGLPTMTIDEIRANPEILLAAYKKKIITVTEQVQAITTDQNQAIRMIFAGVKFDDITKWNEGDFGKYTMAALNSYYSGDRTALEKLEKKLNLDINEDGNTLDLQSGEGVSVYEDPGNNIDDINDAINKLNDSEPPKMIKRKVVPASFGLLVEKEINPAWEAWSKQKQMLKDRKTMIKFSLQKHIVPNQEAQFFIAGGRLIGKDRMVELRKQVIEQFPELELHPKYGTLWHRNSGGRYTTEFDNGKQMLKVLMLNELDFEGRYMGGIKGDTTGELAYPKQFYTTGSNIAGKLKDEDLVEIKGYRFGNSSVNSDAQKIRIRKDVAPHLEDLLDAAAAENIFLNFSAEKGYGSGYRSLKGSEKAKAEAIKKGKPDLAAEPGHSTHNLGAGVDFSFSSDYDTAVKQLNWLKENGAKYGFFPYSPGGKGEPDYNLNLHPTDFNKDDPENWHWDYRPDLMTETN